MVAQLSVVTKFVATEPVATAVVREIEPGLSEPRVELAVPSGAVTPLIVAVVRVAIFETGGAAAYAAVWAELFVEISAAVNVEL